MKLFSFPKSQRINSKKSIDLLFSSGKRFFCSPLQAIYIVSGSQQGESPVRALFVVSKKRFKKAVTRNLIRRRMKEVFRLNKQMIIELCESQGKQVSIAFVFSSTHVAKFGSLQTAIQRILREISKHV